MLEAIWYLLQVCFCLLVYNTDATIIGQNTRLCNVTSKLFTLGPVYYELVLSRIRAVSDEIQYKSVVDPGIS